VIKLFIDGREGTTGLLIDERLRGRGDVEILTLPEEKRKDQGARKDALHSADFAILCLPDDAARESAALAEGSKCRVLDASTAHRTGAGWVYGFPELNKGQTAAIAHAGRVSVPGCHAIGFVALTAPLVASGILSPDSMLSCFSITGYTGGGKSLIATYEQGREPGDKLCKPRPYALGLTHKHLPEMTRWSGLRNPPVFTPILGDFDRGMVVSIPLAMDAGALYSGLAKHYEGTAVAVRRDEDTAGLDPAAFRGRDGMEILVFGHGRQALLCARFDNLGKGSSGVAVQCLELMMEVQA
jgi:N-acetyl-gamma-glutamyl-phosphate reductase